MRVALDAQLTVGTATGIGEYVRGLAGALRAIGVDVVELMEPKLDPWRFDRRVAWDQMVLPARAKRSGATVLHCASGTMPLHACNPMVVTVHDVAWLHVQAHARSYARYYFGSLALRRYRYAERIAVDSHFSRGELLALLGDYDPARVEVVYPGVSQDFCRSVRGAGDRRTILAVGTVERRKNLELLIRVLPSIPNARLVAVGPSTRYEAECRELAGALGVGERVEFRGYVDRDEVLRLYASCAVLALPSRYEGFGYAAAQALCAGTPCVVSDTSALPEIVGDDAPIVSIDDDGAWAHALTRALEGGDDERAARVRPAAIARFGWETGARSMEAVYRAAGG